MPRQKKKTKRTAAKKKAVKKVPVKKPAAKEEEVYYVGIQDPVELKNSLLESAKDLVQYLDRFDQLKNIRERKKAEMEHLKTILSDITKDTNKLKRFLPKTKLRINIHEEKKKKIKKEPVKRASPKIVKKQPKPEEEHEVHDSELAALEEELSAIEGRLTKMT